MYNEIMKTNQRPTYYWTHYYHRMVSGKQVQIKNRFSVYEYCNGESNLLFTINRTPQLLNEMLKRGIPFEDAKSLYYEITEDSLSQLSQID